MPSLKDNLSRWRDSAEIDWFSQFIKAWIPFNAWMTDTYGEKSDRAMLDAVKAGANVVHNGIKPMLTMALKAAPDTKAVWQNPTPDAEAFRSQIAELHRRLQQCVVDGRNGRVSFETVDLGSNPKLVETKTVRGRTLKAERGVPSSGHITISMTATATSPAFGFTQQQHKLSELEGDSAFCKLKPEYRSHLIFLHAQVAPRVVESVLAPPGEQDHVLFADSRFINNPQKLFSALVEVTYCLRNALFHGSITPNAQHNAIYEPAYHIVMRMVKCTI